MKNTFLEFNPISKDLIKKLWDSAIFVFDANVLLNLYRYSDDTSTKFLETIVKLKDRVWLPHQVGLEFNKNRLIVICDESNRYKEFSKKINDIILEVENKNRNPFLSASLFEKLIEVKSDIKKEVEEKIKFYEDSLNNDCLLDKINLAFESKVGNCYTTEELKKIIDEGEKRYKDKVPPGFCDIKKPESERYGDLIIWKQIISKAKSDKNDIIFILDDRKEDWWLEHQGKTISPRPELLKEFNIVSDKNCHFYKPFQFLEYSNQYSGNTIEDEIIEEVKNYKPDIDRNVNFIEINLTLEGKLSDLKLLINEMKNAGYNILIDINNFNNIHEVYIILPSIPDLERRLNSKYLSNLSSYNLKLIRSEKKYQKIT